MWDIRNPKKALSKLCNLPALYEQTDIAFIPGKQTLAVGGENSLTYLNSSSLAIENTFEFDVPDTLKRTCRSKSASISVVRVVYHPELNQIACSDSFGRIHLLYSGENSKNGALLILKKSKAAVYLEANTDEAKSHAPITAAELSKLKRNRVIGGEDARSLTETVTASSSSNVRQTTADSYRPTPPEKKSKLGKGGKIGTGGLTHLIMKGIIKDNFRGIFILFRVCEIICVIR